MEEKLELDEINEKSLKKDRGLQSAQSTKGKNDLLRQFKTELDYHGHDYLNELFAKTDTIENKRFISCLSIHYNFAEEDAAALARELTYFGKIKLSTLKDLNKKDRTPDKRDGDRSRDKKSGSKGWDSKMSPGKERDREQRGKIVDPRKQRVNAPVVRQHIRELISAFCKRFEPS